jgi:4-hydroxy-tetrahydrodipicolinate synthase
MITTNEQLNLSRQPKYAGVIAAMVSPCSSPGVIDSLATERLCSQLAKHGCGGVFIASSTGESHFLDEDDRRILTVAARKALTPETLIYAGVTGLGLKQSIRYSRNAAQDGADVAVIMAPIMFQISQSELADYLLRIAEASPIPVMLYHHYKTSTPIAVETVVRVAEHQNIVGIKDTSPEIERIRSLLIATAGRPFSVLQGSTKLLMESLTLGANGIVAAMANFAPEIHANLYRAVQSHDDAGAKQQNAYLSKLQEVFQLPSVRESISSLACSIKLAAKYRGWLECADVMMPGFRLDDALQTMVQNHLAVLEVRSGVPIGG